MEARAADARGRGESGVSGLLLLPARFDGAHRRLSYVEGSTAGLSRQQAGPRGTVWNRMEHIFEAEVALSLIHI